MKKEKIIGIYKITNLINNKVYIGQSSDIHSRWWHHKNFLKLKTHHNKHLQYAWDKYGADNFKFEILEICNSNQLDEKEKYWIEYYNSYNNGYNLDFGGKGIRGYKHTSEEIDKMRRIQKPAIVLQFDLDYFLVNRWVGGVSHAAKELNITRQSILLRCRHLINGDMSPYKGYYWIYEDEYNFPDFSWEKYLNNIPVIKMGSLCESKIKEDIIQYDRAGNKIAIWKTLEDLLDAGYDIDKIRMICNHTANLKTHKNFIWSYKSYDFSDKYFDDVILNYTLSQEKHKIKQSQILSKKPKNRPVCMLDNKGNILRTFNDSRSASLLLTGKKTSIATSISRACNNPNKTSYGHHWKYA